VGPPGRLSVRDPDTGQLRGHAPDRRPDANQQAGLRAASGSTSEAFVGALFGRCGVRPTSSGNGSDTQR